MFNRYDLRDLKLAATDYFCALAEDMVNLKRPCKEVCDFINFLEEILPEDDDDSIIDEAIAIGGDHIG